MNTVPVLHFITVVIYVRKCVLVPVANNVNIYNWAMHYKTLRARNVRKMDKFRRKLVCLFKQVKDAGLLHYGKNYGRSKFYSAGQCYKTFHGRKLGLPIIS